MGIGTLIIFIAMILVAAIAAGVLIQTATSLQNKALLTGERSKSQISTSLSPLLIYAQDGSNGNNVQDFFLKMKLSPGSDPIKLEDMLVEMNLNNASIDLTYLETVDGSDATCEAGSYNETNDTFFFVDYLIKSTNSASGYLQRGDVIKVCFRAPRNVSEDESVGISFVPKVGNPLIIDLAMPDIITQQRITVYP
jgi:archaellin